VRFFTETEADMTRLALLGIALAITLLSPRSALAQYNRAAARSAPMDEVMVRGRGSNGQWVIRKEYRAPKADRYGNAAGNQYDLAVDGAFKGQTVVVLHFYVDSSFDFSLPRAALKEKGFSVYRYSNAAPSPAELKKALARACQLWIISGDRQLLNAEHLKVIKAFFDAGHGVYIWGDNEPYYADANYVARTLLGAEMKGNLPGAQTVTLWKGEGKPGVRPNHLLTTGLAHLFEGITIATLQLKQSLLKPLVFGSAKNLVTAYFDANGKRAILDGGFTRLYCNWDTAGTARYVKNAAAWLVNYERFGKRVLAEDLRASR
jgi:hypothetical protein